MTLPLLSVIYVYCEGWVQVLLSAHVTMAYGASLFHQIRVFLVSKLNLELFNMGFSQIRKHKSPNSSCLVIYVRHKQRHCIRAALLWYSD